MGIVKSANFTILIQAGAFLGFASFGFFADWLGRRPAFLIFVLGAALVVPIYGWSADNRVLLLTLGPVVGFLGHGYFSVFGAMLAELFPSPFRATAQGLCYNAGRAASALAPSAVGFIAESKGLGSALAMTSVLYLVGAAFFLFLPETRGTEIE